MAPYVKSSASQINTFGECETHWYNASILKMPVPQSVYAAAGDVDHKGLEDYSNHGTMPTSPSALLALTYLAPPKSTGVFIEAWLNPPLKVAGVEIRGRIDYVDERDPSFPQIIDFKTKKKFDRYLKTKRTLPKDLQATIYGAHMLEKFPKAEAVSFAHLYLLRGDVGNVKFVEVVLPREDVFARLADTAVTVERMKGVADGTITPEKNTQKCNRWYGGECPFKSVCLTDVSFDSLFAGETGETVTLFETLKLSPGASEVPDPARFVGTASATPVPVAAVTDATPAPEDEGDLLSQLRAMAYRAGESP